VRLHAPQTVFDFTAAPAGRCPALGQALGQALRRKLG
jgi:hypothetical protein